MEGKLYRRPETIEINPNSKPRREDFGPGEAGSVAYEIVLRGLPCGVLLPATDSGIRVRCGMKSGATLDFDDYGTGSKQFDFIPVCSEEHFVLASYEITQEALKAGTHTAIGRNGWGRA